MAFQLRHDQSLGKNLRRLCRGQTRAAARELRGKGSADRDTAIHNFRRHTKRVRSVLRLTRYQLGEALYRRENACFRDAARALAGSRDAAVMCQALRQLTQNEGAAAAGSPAVAQFGDILSEHYEQTVSTHLDTQGVLGAVAVEMETAVARVEKWPLTSDWSSVAKGLKRVYRQGRRTMHTATGAPTFEAYHEWRKRVKCLWHHVLILAPIWPETLPPLARELRELALTLGDDHDLTVLQEACERHAPAIAGRDGLPELLQGMARRRVVLRERARLVGQRIYAEKPRAFARRMTAYWEAWQAAG